MGCNCGSRRNSKNTSYIVTYPDGTRKSYSSEYDARLEAARSKGTVRQG